MWNYKCYLTRLYHHGVKGQKWGVRHGPPYPIDSSSGLKLVSLKIAAKNGILVTGMSGHANDQAKERGVKSDDIVDAVQHPLYIRNMGKDKQDRESVRFIGNAATVNVNPHTGVIATVWPTGTKDRKKYMKGD